MASEHQRPSSAPSGQVLALASKASSEVTYLSMLLPAYQLVERYVTSDDHATPSRKEVSSLLRALNSEMQRRLNALSDATAVLKTSLGESQNT